MKQVFHLPCGEHIADYNGPTGDNDRVDADLWVWRDPAMPKPAMGLSIPPCPHCGQPILFGSQRNVEARDP